MGWLTAKNSADDGHRAPSTISDKEWRGLQDRAAKANPERWRFGTPEHAEGARRGSEQYRNRKNN